MLSEAQLHLIYKSDKHSHQIKNHRLPSQAKLLNCRL